MRVRRINAIVCRGYKYDVTMNEELGGRSGNLAWHAPTNDYRKTKFPCRKTRIAGISQSKFVPTVVNDLRRKMRGWMRGECATKRFLCKFKLVFSFSVQFVTANELGFWWFSML
jgi:hypothetical protein